MKKKNTTVVDTAEKSSGKEEKIPKPIVLLTVNGESIVMEAISATKYIKCYYSAEVTKSGVLDSPRRVKEVTLPVLVNNKVFRETYPLFMELVNHCGYRKL